MANDNIQSEHFALYNNSDLKKIERPFRHATSTDGDVTLRFLLLCIPYPDGADGIIIPLMIPGNHYDISQFICPYASYIVGALGFVDENCALLLADIDDNKGGIFRRFGSDIIRGRLPVWVAVIVTDSLHTA
jgi:hypothetical protein